MDVKATVREGAKTAVRKSAICAIEAVEDFFRATRRYDTYTANGLESLLCGLRRGTEKTFNGACAGGTVGAIYGGTGAIIGAGLGAASSAYFKRQDFRRAIPETVQLTQNHPYKSAQRTSLIRRNGINQVENSSYLTGLAGATVLATTLNAAVAYVSVPPLVNGAKAFFVDDSAEVVSENLNITQPLPADVTTLGEAEGYSIKRSLR